VGELHLLEIYRNVRVESESRSRAERQKVEEAWRMLETSCPQCGETEDLAGVGAATEGDGIEVRCGACGSVFARGVPCCRSCGGSEWVAGTQQMTRHPRGTLLAVVGGREIRLCAHCDRDVLGQAGGRRPTVPEGYVSRFLRGDDAPVVEAAGAEVRRRRERASGRRLVSVPTPPATEHRPPHVSDPTVRQATAAFLEHVDGADNLCLVLLGSMLGASTRLSAADTPETAERLAEWVTETWRTSPSDKRLSAVGTICDAVDHWRREGWLRTDLASKLR